MKPNYGLRITHLSLAFSLLTALLAACQPQVATPDQNIALTAAFETAVAQIVQSSQPSATPLPPATPIPTVAAPRTPPALPGIYQSGLLKPEDLPRTYVADSCQYLKNKWDSTKSAPGTVVMVVMHHGINKGDASGNDVTVGQHKQIMNDMYESGFTAINMQHHQHAANGRLHVRQRQDSTKIRAFHRR